MSTSRSILVVIAHPDDLEVMAGGTVARWIAEGHRVHVLTFTHGSWTSPDGQLVRGKEGVEEERRAATYLGYSVENLGYQTLEMSYRDRHVCEVLDRIAEHSVDTIITNWDRDLHHDHEVVSRISVAASRRVSRVLMGQTSYHLRDIFTPNYFVDISETWQRKLGALAHFEGESERQGKDWPGFMDVTTRYYGMLCGVERAEGFLTRKFLY